MVGLPISFAWANFSVLAIGVWAIAQRDSIDAVIMVSLCVGSLVPRPQLLHHVTQEPNYRHIHAYPR